jgi:hypothetical protein
MVVHSPKKALYSRSFSCHDLPESPMVLVPSRSFVQGFRERPFNSIVVSGVNLRKGERPRIGFGPSVELSKATTARLAAFHEVNQYASKTRALQAAGKEQPDFLVGDVAQALALSFLVCLVGLFSHTCKSSEKKGPEVCHLTPGREWVEAVIESVG